MRGIVAVGLFLICLLSTAQDAIIDSISSRHIVQEDTRLDSVVNNWYIQGREEVIVPDTVVIDASMVGKGLPDSVYIQRLADIVSPIYFTYNSKVKSHIELYTLRRRDQVRNMLALSNYYFPMFEEALDARNLPLELKYMAVIESALNPKAYSRAGASGLWQFMYYTGKQYGLTINSYVDERRDPYQSTLAAVDFLEDLYGIYQDWLLVIAAYNCGPGNVNKAIRRSGGVRDFWKIYYHLPRETRGYVPAFIAAAYTFEYAADHHLYASSLSLPSNTDTIMVNKPLHFKQVAEMLDTDLEHLRALNPQYRRDVVPAQKEPYALRLSFSDASNFAGLEDTIYAHKRDVYFQNDKLITNPQHTSYSGDVPSNKAAVYYTVKSGDAIGLIADWYDVRTSDLRYWNNIRKNLIRVNQKLVVYVPKHKVAYYSKVNSMTHAQKQGSKATVNSSSAKPKTSVVEDPNYVYYTVRSGDNLWTIAEKYNGVSNQDIMRLNSISDARKIAPGQKLKIKKKS